MKETSRKLQFALDVEDDWPPVASEAVWCDLVEAGFQLRNAPFFIKGLAVDDVFEAIPDSVNGHVFEFKVVQPSSHSLAWMINNTKGDADPILDSLRKLGCSTEGLKQFSLYAIDIPPTVPEAELNTLLDRAEKLGFDLAFPVWRRD